MNYTVDKSVFEINPGVKFGIIVGAGIKNSDTTKEDEERLRNAENNMCNTVTAEQLRSLPNVALYRDIMAKANINPNKYPPSVEAMFKRILKGGHLPTINSLVDLCNAVSIEHIISLGGHDLADIHEDLEVRFSRKGDRFLPFGSTEYEEVDDGELVFTSGNTVQTRKWVWRQSELGKITLNSSNVFFQLVGFEDDYSSFISAMNKIESLVTERFGGACKKYIVDINNQSVEF
jgi:DNA/RNA-binding domain of Phe-tRNA-synthetase-like protein